ncbi:MAG: ABC transporter substrate-binding protein [Oscillibacter sp.]|nr:ABC transporter substrate-binding protein [Oscillibacter sp.]
MEKIFRKNPAFLLVVCLILSSCAADRTQAGEAPASEDSGRVNTERFLTLVTENPDTVDPQCTSEHYAVALNVFDRLVEVRADSERGSSELAPSLAESWEISPDGLTYSFRLREGVTFSNGSPLTASDVKFTLTRLLTHPDSCNRDIAAAILGAEALSGGAAKTLEGFREDGDYEFSITLAYPYAAFLACLSTPGASVLDEESVTEAGGRFGKDPEYTVGTGPFVFKEWAPGVRMVFAANPDCWSGAPRCDGLDMRIVSDSEAQRLLFENGELDILDLDNMSSEAAFFLHGDIYQDRLVQGSRVGISYIALNESVKPLDDPRVRRALQFALDRQALLNAVFDGRGQLENGIFPHGLIGFNPNLPEIPHDPEEAARLLADAGYADGFDLTVSYPSNSTDAMRELLNLTAFMWGKIGVRAALEELPEEEFMSRRKRGALSCYSGTWSADFNDPDNFIYTFFGTEENTLSRSLLYPDGAVMERVRRARAITDEAGRIREYQDLERKIAQEDAAWIPLFSRQHIFVVSDRVDGFEVSWNGWSSNNYSGVSVSK